MDGKQKPMDGGSSMDHQHEEMVRSVSQIWLGSFEYFGSILQAMEDEQLLMNGEQPVDVMPGEDWTMSPLKNMGLGGIPKGTLRLFMEVKMTRHYS